MEGGRDGGCEGADGRVFEGPATLSVVFGTEGSGRVGTGGLVPLVDGGVTTGCCAATAAFCRVTPGGKGKG
jgi:hypothetical protein